MDYYFNIILFSGLSYLIGSFSTAIITCKIMGIEDPRKTGSNNPGATNVLRHGGKKAAIITLFGDALKGLIPVLVANQFHADDLTISFVGLFALIGHIFPVYYYCPYEFPSLAVAVLEKIVTGQVKQGVNKMKAGAI